LHVLNGASLTVAAGEMVALVGPSGSGKSTLMHIAGLLERPDGGAVRVAGEDCTKAGDADRTRLRRTRIGFVYQYHHLLPEFSAEENVVLPQMIRGRSKREARAKARELLGLVGLGDRTQHRPGQLSGGEQQRVAMARALANDPNVLLADEPTGNLDPHTSDKVFDVLTHLVRQVGLAAVVATHNLELAGQMDRTLRLEEGRLVQLDRVSASA
jgi:lipoprotein-releasing system ATP-binding protein